MDELVAFCLGCFVDSEHGEWYTACHADGAVKDDRKGGSWKAAYHTVQACFYAYAQLSALGEAACGGSREERGRRREPGGEA